MFTISPGHWKLGTGASDLVDEVREARKVVQQVASILQANGQKVTVVQDNQSSNQQQNLNYLIKHHNASQRTLDISIHFNAVAGRRDEGIGTEVLYADASMKTLAQKMSAAISKAGQLKDRGAKLRKELAILTKTNRPAIIIEVCFVNSVTDVMYYQKNFQVICAAIAETLAPAITCWKFTDPAMDQQVTKLWLNPTQITGIISTGITHKVFSPIWLERYLEQTISKEDFLGLCTLLAVHLNATRK